MSETQLKIIAYLQGHGESTKADLYEHCAGYYHQNGKFHFGNILSNMVDKGMIERVKKGVFKIKIKQQLPCDIGLFEDL